MEGWLDLLDHADVILTVHTKTVSLTGSDTADLALVPTPSGWAASTPCRTARAGTPGP